jgi:hypothetical protein
MRNETARNFAPPPERYDGQHESQFRRDLHSQIQAMIERLPTPLVATATWNPANMAADGDIATTTVDVRGAVVGDPVSVGLTTLAGQNCIIAGKVSAADQVEVVLFNKSGGALDLASGTLTVIVWKV